MENQFPKPEWKALSNALYEKRDSFTRLSLLLSDFLWEIPSIERDEVANDVVERRLAKIFDSERRSHE
jgi:hypothetical protein